LLALCARLAGQIQYAVRDRGDAFPASQTLAEGKGACRDTALLFMEACRAMGLASRFVSGYAEGYVQQGRRDLHAWAEVYLPGGGWRGYDPSMGIAVVDRHVAVSAGSVPALAAPLVGTFVGGAVTTNLWYDISMVMKPA
jgi:transglutaminase-like putative cysteine protease